MMTAPARWHPHRSRSRRGGFAPIVSPGPSNARTFDGVTQYGKILNNPDVQVGGDVSFEWFLRFYLDTPSIATYYAIISKARYDYEAIINDNGTVTFFIRKSDDSGPISVTTTATVTPQAWQTFWFGYDDVNNQLFAKLNGTTTVLQPWDGGGFNGTADLSLASLDATTPSFPFVGSRSSMFFRKGTLMTSPEFTWMTVANRIYSDLGQIGNDGQDMLTDMVSFWNFDEYSPHLDIADFHSGNDWVVVGNPGTGEGP